MKSLFYNLWNDIVVSIFSVFKNDKPTEKEFVGFICEHNKPFPSNQHAIEKYDDFKIMGRWGTYNPQTNEITGGGDMLSRTVKFKDDVDGSIKIGTEWVPDNCV